MMNKDSNLNLELKVELVYEKTCVHIKAYRTQLVRALNELDLSPHWTEWDVMDEDVPEAFKDYTSVTLLINNKKIIVTSTDNKVVPSVDDIVLAIKSTQALSKKSAKKFFGLNLAMLPTVGLAFLPKLFCPACWPAYAGLLSSVGIGFFDYTSYILPAMLAFVVIALSTLIYKARQRRGYMPFFIGLSASVILLMSKFYWDSDVMMWVGLVLLISASLWNTWPRQAHADCPACSV